MDNEKHVGYELRQTDIMIRRFAEHRRTAAGYGDLTFAQGGMIHYLYRHREEPIYQKDLEKRFDIRRSTATGILQNLEKNGYGFSLSLPLPVLHLPFCWRLPVQLHKLLNRDI